MKDTVFYERINLLDDDALEKMPAPTRAPRVRPKPGKALSILLVALLYTGAWTLLIFALALALGYQMPSARGGALVVALGYGLITLLMFALATLKGRLTC